MTATILLFPQRTSPEPVSDVAHARIRLPMHPAEQVFWYYVAGLVAMVIAAIILQAVDGPPDRSAAPIRWHRGYAHLQQPAVSTPPLPSRPVASAAQG